MRIAFFGDSLTSAMPGSSYLAILRERFPDDKLLNFGKGNDTVVSLHRRISAMRFNTPLDVAFLWIGANDVPPTERWSYHAFHTLLRQRRARDMGEFRSSYRATLRLLCDRAGRVIVAPPALKGENLENCWNRRLADLAGWIKEVTADYDEAEFLDLRVAFARELAGKPLSDHVPKNLLRVLLDALTLRTDEKIDAKAMERGLHLTLDGVHLNSAGAKLVAEEFAAAIGRGAGGGNPQGFFTTAPGRGHVRRLRRGGGPGACHRCC
jgi:lysophospholipase L1-like esterase